MNKLQDIIDSYVSGRRESECVDYFKKLGCYVICESCPTGLDTSVNWNEDVSLNVCIFKTPSGGHCIRWMFLSMPVDLAIKILTLGLP